MFEKHRERERRTIGKDKENKIYKETERNNKKKRVKYGETYLDIDGEEQ